MNAKKMLIFLKILCLSYQLLGAYRQKSPNPIDTLSQTPNSKFVRNFRSRVDRFQNLNETTLSPREKRRYSWITDINDTSDVNSEYSVRTNYNSDVSVDSVRPKTRRQSITTSLLTPSTCSRYRRWQERPKTSVVNQKPFKFIRLRSGNSVFINLNRKKSKPHKVDDDDTEDRMPFSFRYEKPKNPSITPKNQKLFDQEKHNTDIVTKALLVHLLQDHQIDLSNDYIPLNTDDFTKLPPLSVKSQKYELLLGCMMVLLSYGTSADKKYSLISGLNYQDTTVHAFRTPRSKSTMRVQVHYHNEDALPQEIKNLLRYNPQQKKLDRYAVMINPGVIELILSSKDAMRLIDEIKK